MKKEETGSELVVVEDKNIPAIFEKGGSQSILAKLKEVLDSFIVPDVTTTKGQKEIASFARKFSKSKTLLEGHGKALVEKEKARLSIIDAERKKIKETCDEYRDAARKPLTDYEDAEKMRTSEIETRIKGIENYVEQIYIDSMGSILTSECLSLELDKLKAIVVDNSFEEFELAATKAKAKVVEQLEAKFIVLQNTEKEAAEAKRLEEERLETERVEREKKIADDAAAEATKKAEEKAKDEQEEKDRLTKEEIDKANREKLEAELATKRAEDEKMEAAELAETEKKEAVEAETKRIEDERIATEAEATKKAENKRHRNKIHKEIDESIKKWSLTTKWTLNEEERKSLVDALVEGTIANITIKY